MGQNRPSRNADQTKGLVFDIRRYCVHDGPGIRTTVFFKGCPLSCWWCHNPEGRSQSPSLMFFPDRCLQCGECVSVCPHNAIVDVNGSLETDSQCVACGTCVPVCAADARQIAGRWMTVREVMQQIEKDLVFYDESFGGVTFSGGEPLYQPAFLHALLDACAERRLHTVVETCGYAHRDLLLTLSKKVDVFYYDLKIIDSEKHRKYVGVPNNEIVGNLEALAEQGNSVVVRIPVIPGINDDPGEIQGMARLLQRSQLRKVHLLPYHRAGTGKYARLHMPYLLGDVEAASSESIQSIAQQLEQSGFLVSIGGGQ
jgi:pyruvate formate lyase activating enzyme